MEKQRVKHFNKKRICDIKCPAMNTELPLACGVRSQGKDLSGKSNYVLIMCSACPLFQIPFACLCRGS